MTDREKLIELIQSAVDGCATYWAGLIADNILASDFINCLQNEAYDLGVDSILHDKFGLSWDDAAGLRKEIQRLQNATRWIPVTERLPEENVRVLVCFRFTDYSRIEMDTDRIEKGKWYRWSKYVTHWMPLPQPPKGE